MQARWRWTWWLGLLIIASMALPALAGGKPAGGGKPGGDEDPPAPPADPAIAYVQKEGKAWNLKVMNADGTNQTLLVPDAGDRAEPCWSPDGTKLLFESADPVLGNGLYVVPVDGSAPPTRLVSTMNRMNGAEWSPVPAPDHRYRIVWTDTVSYSNRYDVYVINDDGTGLLNLTEDMPGGEQLSHLDPTWSRDGSKIVVVRGFVPEGSAVITRELVEYTLGKNTQTGVLEIQDERNLALGALAGQRLYDPSFGREADTILVSVYEYVNELDNREIWEIDLAALSSPTQLTDTDDPISKNKAIQERHPDYAPDDGRMVYRIFDHKGGSDGGIYVKDTALSATPVRLVDAAEVKDPAWRR